MQKEIIYFTNRKDASITTYLWEAKKSSRRRPMVIICPGGDYQEINEREAEPIAMQYFAEGFNVIVLRYSTVKVKKILFPVPWRQLGQTVQLVHQNMDIWRLNGDILLTGFSSGAHLCLSYLTLIPQFAKSLKCSEEELSVTHFIDNYGITDFSNGWSDNDFAQKLIPLLLREKQGMYRRKVLYPLNFLPEKMPNTFIWHSITDNKVPVSNALFLLQACQNRQTNVACHLFSTGKPHNEEETKVTTEESDDWFPLAIKWYQQTKKVII